MSARTGLLAYRRTNAVLAWSSVGALVAAAVVHSTSAEYGWAVMALGAAVVALVPPVASGRWREMVAWEVVALAALPVVASVFVRREVALGTVAVAALALVVAVVLDAVTGVEMTPDFAVGFVVVTTMAVAGLWVIVRYASDLVLGTSLLAGQTAVMWDLVLATAVGVAAGVVFELYVRRISRGHELARRPGGGGE